MEQADDRQGGRDWESENDDGSANCVNCVDQAVGLMGDWIGLENPGSEQGDTNQNKPPTTDRPRSSLQRGPKRDEEGKNTHPPGEERQPHHPAKMPDLILTDHAPGRIEFPLEEVQQEQDGKENRSKNNGGVS